MSTSAPTSAVRLLAPASLRPHPLNERIYGDDGASDEELRGSIREHGVLVPLVVLPDGRIISGHRRWGAARAEGVPLVPTSAYPGDPEDETEIKAALLEHNRQREKTPEQRAREVAAMMEIEHERMRRKQQAHGGTAPGRPATLVARVPQVSRNGRAPAARDVVADLTGMGARQVDKAVAVIQTMDDLIVAGDYKGAEELRQTLNQAGIGPAYKEVRRARGQATGPIRPPGAEAPPQEKRNAIPHDPVRAGEVIRKNFSREFAVTLLAELQRLLSEGWS